MGSCSPPTPLPPTCSRKEKRWCWGWYSEISLGTNSITLCCLQGWSPLHHVRKPLFKTEFYFQLIISTHFYIILFCSILIFTVRKMWSTVFTFHFTSAAHSISIIHFYHPAALQTLLWKCLSSAPPAVSLNSPGVMAKLFALKKEKLNCWYKQKFKIPGGWQTTGTGVFTAQRKGGREKKKA